MEIYVCQTCDYVYDPKEGDEFASIEPGTSFEDLPEGWTCPDCGDDKSSFEVMGSAD